MFVFQKLSSKTLGCDQMIGGLSRIRRATDLSNLTLYDYHKHNFETFFVTAEKLDSPYTLFYYFLHFCQLYYVPSIILLGLVGNLLSCVVFLKTHLKLRSSSYYLAALATADISFLMSLLLTWIDSTIGWKVFHNNGWCETVAYVSGVCSSLSVWLIVAFTVERFIAVQYPLHRPHMCTVARAKTIILVLTILALVSHSYSFVIAGMVKNHGNEVCNLKIEYLETIQIISIIDSIASLIVPIVLIIVMNTMIIRNLLKSGRRFNQESGYTANCPNRENSDINLNQISSANSSNNGSGGNTNLVSIVGTNGTQRPPSQQSSVHSSKNHSRHQPASAPSSSQRNVCQMTEIEAPYVMSSCRNLGLTIFNQESITKMLVLISTVFILLNLPSYVIRLYLFFELAKHTSDTVQSLQQFFMLLYYTHFSINFLLYAVCGTTFRQCLKQILRRILKSMTRCHCSPRRKSISP